MLALVGLSGCLMLADPPDGHEGAYCGNSEDCLDGFVCCEEYYASCFDEHSYECLRAGEVSECVDSECPGGYGCYEGACRTDCFDDDDCRQGYMCCTYENGDCTDYFEAHTCVLE